MTTPTDKDMDSVSYKGKAENQPHNAGSSNQQSLQEAIEEIIKEVHEQGMMMFKPEDLPDNFYNLKFKNEKFGSVTQATQATLDHILSALPEEWELYGEKDSNSYHEALGFNEALKQVRRIIGGEKE